MVTGSVIFNAEAGVMVQTLVVASQLGALVGILNLMASAATVAFASSMAALSVHWLPVLREVSHLPLVFLSEASPVLLTVKVVAAWAGLAVISRHAAMNAATTKPNARALPFASRCC